MLQAGTGKMANPHLVSLSIKMLNDTNNIKKGEKSFLSFLLRKIFFTMCIFKHLRGKFGGRKKCG